MSGAKQHGELVAFMRGMHTIWLLIAPAPVHSALHSNLATSRRLKARSLATLQR